MQVNPLVGRDELTHKLCNFAVAVRPLSTTNRLAPVSYEYASETRWLRVLHVCAALLADRVGTLTRSECIIVIIYGWYQSFILISW